MQSNIPYNNSDDTKYNFKKKKQKVYINIVDTVKYDGKSDSDPLGMYTGVPVDPFDVPEQDADDLQDGKEVLTQECFGGESPLTTCHFGGFRYAAKMTDLQSGCPDCRPNGVG